ncbi:MAG: glucose-6-phosphate isomerase [Longimonas sp.]|uniref:glucose-6-phosphate isomerase n=1 Tax=Longimonas sp. TaxID=2039626 RepID=UPI0039762817
MIRLDDTHVRPFLDAYSSSDLPEAIQNAQATVQRGDGPGNNFLGWRTLAESPNEDLISEIEAHAKRLHSDADALLCLGIGGSYLGAKAVIDALTPYFPADDDDTPEVYFAGHQTSGAYLKQLLAHLDGQSVFVNVISKSGTTLETALAFRIVRQWMEERFDDADDRIITTTSPEGGALNALREDHDYTRYVIPPDVGGRFSVLTPVGLLPIAAAGIDIRALMEGASEMHDHVNSTTPNASLQYAALRYALLHAGYDVEVLATFEPSLASIGAWWQQLFGESEGKDGKGLFPASVEYTTDLHSLGQYMQDGQRIVMETFLMAEDAGEDLTVPTSEADLDGLNYVADRPMRAVTQGAYEGTAQAHTDGGVPNCTLWLDDISPTAIGALIYFFEHAVAVSGYALGVNPFNQPGVEDYKREMYQRLGR